MSRSASLYLCKETNKIQSSWPCLSFQVFPGVGCGDVGFVGEEVAPDGVLETGGADQLID